MKILKRATQFVFVCLSCIQLYAFNPLQAQVVSTDERPVFIRSGNVVPSQKNQAKKKISAFSYTNPIIRDTSIAMRDHFIIKVADKWYATGTSSPVWTGYNPGVRLLVSDDMINWKQHSFIIDGSKLPADCPYNGRFWAPEIHYIQSKFWLTVNSGRLRSRIPKE